MGLIQVVHGSANVLPILLREEDSFDMETTNKTSKGMGWRVTVSILTFSGSLIGIILWLFFYAEDFSVYQNIAVVVVMLLGFVGVMGATWASWGMRQGAGWNDGGDPKSG